MCVQGVEPFGQNWEGIPYSAIGGSTMTVPVLEFVIREALLTTGLAQPTAGAPIVFP